MLLSASLVPENDSSVLFNTAGMQPLIPYLLGEEHPKGNRLVNVQKCVRTQDIDEVGDNTHDTFFEMMGNWSLGDYFKKEAIEWSYEFLTSTNEGLGLDPKRLYITVFGGNADAPKDQESFDIWKKYMPESRIYFLTHNGKKEPNWWEVGENGPCGPDTEMFYDITEEGLGDMTKEEYLKADNEQKVVEIWNDVFMQYIRKDGKVVGELPKKNVDTGAGLERVVMVIQGKNNIFDTDLWADIVMEAKKISHNQKSERIISDHLRTAAFIISDGVAPKNSDRGYVLRRLIRRAVFNTIDKTLPRKSVENIVHAIIRTYDGVYPNLTSEKEKIILEIVKESEKFEKTIGDGLKQFEKLSDRDISGSDAFALFSTYGFPIEMTEELAKEKNIAIDTAGFKVEMKKHQELSRAGAEQKFKPVLE